MTTTILLVRHADVQNPGRVFYGRLPRFRISALGRQQAALVAEQLAELPIACFYSSPMLRARQTAAVLAARHPGVPIRLSARLNEVRTGWIGTVDHELPARINLYEPRHSPDDETIEDVWQRVDGLIRGLRQRHAGATVCLVSHGDPIVVAHAGYRGLPLALDSIRGSFYPQKCSLTRLVFEPGADLPRVEYRDIVRELAPELVAPY